MAPLDRAEVFAPGIVSTVNTEIMYGSLNGGRRLIFERTPPDFKEGDTAQIFLMELINGQWSNPTPSIFPISAWYKNFNDIGAGEDMVIARARPKNTPDDRFLLDLWSVQKTETGWAEAIPLAINSDRFDTWPSVTADGTLYFFSGRDGGLGGHDIYRSEKRNGVYLSVENLGSKFNTAGEDMRPILSADGKVLFFTSNVSEVLNIHWVDSSFVERFRPEKSDS